MSWGSELIAESVNRRTPYVLYSSTFSVDQPDLARVPGCFCLTLDRDNWKQINVLYASSIVVYRSETIYGLTIKQGCSIS
jgi:hypothetical protein